MRKRNYILLIHLLFAFGFMNAQNSSQTFTTSGSFTVPSGVTSIVVECWGAGGSGGGSTTDNIGGGGGGGGAYAKSTILVTSGDVIPFTVGTGGTASTGNGTAGGNTIFNTNIVVAVGGNGGGANSGGAGGIGGLSTSCTGETVLSGGNGATGSGGTSGGGGGAAGSTEVGGAASGITGGIGGSLGGGSGANGRSDAGNGSNGATYGGGGSGGRKGGLLTSSRSGGIGANGAIKISYTVPDCSGNPNPAGVVSSNLYTGCAGTSITLSATGVSTDFGVEYKWLKSTDGGANWVDASAYTLVPPSGAFTLAQTISVSTQFKLETRCTMDANLTSYSNVITFSVNCWTTAVNTVVTNCGGTFYDSGGSTGDYALSQTYTYTFYPANAGEKIRMIFTQFATESGWDGMVIYNGNSSAAPMISSGLAVGSSTTNCPAGSWYGTTSPGTITSSAVDGSITIVFRSDASTNAAGWTAQISCVDVPASPNTPTSNSPNCDNVTITQNGTPPAGEVWYWQTTANGTSTTNSNLTLIVTTSGTYYIRSLKTSNNEWSLPTSIAVVVNSLPICASTPAPANAANGVCYAGYSKVSSLTWVAVAGATSYDVYFAQDAIPSTLTANVATNSYTLPANLLPSASYFWKVIPKNSCGEASSCAEWSFNTASTICYCPSTSTSATSYFNSFSTTGGVTNITNSTSGYSTGGYGNFTSLVASQVQGGTINFNSTLVGTTVGVNIWVDWNQDGDFDDAGEKVYGSGAYVSAATGSFNVPITASTGNTRMRIRLDYNATNPAICGSITRGETEDYTFNVLLAPNTPDIPTSNSPSCDSVLISRTGTPPVGEEWYWQTTNNGVSISNSNETYTVYNSGTYYLRSMRISDGAWGQAASIAVVVNKIPSFASTPTPANNSTGICFSGNGTIATLSWASTLDATSYDVYFGSGSLPTDVSANVATNSFTLPSSLLANTTYYWKIVPKSVCGDAINCPIWSFTTSSSPCACTPATLTCTYENITKVVFAGINNSSTCSTNGYGNYSNLSPAQVVKGQTYPLAVTVTCDGTEYVGAWLDYNNNGVFESTEYLSVGNTSTTGAVLTQNVTIPLTSESGLIRLRVRVNYNAAIVNTESCSSSSTYGEVEDYLVNVCVVPNKPETPVSNSPQCGVVELSVNATPPVDEIWYWQTSSNGTSTTSSAAQYNATTSAWYYLRAKNSCGLWSVADSVLVEVYQNSVSANSIDGNTFALANESVDLTVVGGSLGYGAQWRWYSDNCGSSLPIGEGSTITVNPSVPINNYFVRAEGLCDTTTCVQHTIELYQPSAGICDVIYVSSSGNDSYAGTIDFPVKSLYRALQLVNTDRKHVKMEASVFNETKRTNLPSNVKVEGGFKIINGVWVKTNSIRTQIHYSETSSGNNPTISSVDENTMNLIGISSNSVSGWTLQDIDVLTSNVSLHSASGNGVNNYALWINSSSNYTIFGCNIVSGNASNGIDGVPVTGYLALGGVGGNGASAGNNIGLNGTDGQTVLNGATGGSGNIGGAGCTGGCRAGNGVNGINGVDGITWNVGDKPIATIDNAIYFIPIASTDGQAGGGGGGAGGGGGSDSYNIGLCGALAGGKGGNGGRGGNGGTGGKAGGGSFGIWMYDSNTNSYILNSNVIAGNHGVGGLGSEGVIGENGQTGIAGASGGGGLCSSSNGGGTGGTGGKGGNGGRGRDGADGLSANIVNDGFVSSSNYTFASNPEVKIYQTANKVCRNSQIVMVKQSGSNDWDFGGDLLYVNDLNVMSSSYTNASDSVTVYSPYVNYTYNLTSPVEFGRFLVTTSDDRVLPTLTINPTTICQNTGNINFSATSWGNEEAFEWIIFQDSTTNIVLTSNSQIPNFDISSLQAGVYQVSYRAKESCCGWSIPVYSQFVINPAPETITVTGGGTICSSTTTLYAESIQDGTIYWQGTTSNGTSTSDGTTIQNITSNGTYYFRAVSSLGCWNEQTEVNVILNTPPSAVTVSGGTTQCGGSVLLTANGGSGGTIYFQGATQNGTSITTATNTYTATTSGIYYFRSQSSDGCWGQEGSAVLVINSVPEDVTVLGGGTYCGSPVLLSASGGNGGVIYWQNTTSNGVSTSSQVSSYGVTTSGTYYFRAKSPEGCWSNQGSAVVVINNPPSNLLVSSLTHHSAQLSWTENGSANLWNIEWGVAGFTLGTGNTILNVTQNPYVLNGLAPSTSYDFYVRSVCSASDVGAWSSVKNFTTLVNSISDNRRSESAIWAFDNILYVELPNSESLKEIMVYDMQGRLILTSKTKITSLDAFETGIYVVRVTSDKQIRVEKIKIIK